MIDGADRACHFEIELNQSGYRSSRRRPRRIKSERRNSPPNLRRERALSRGHPPRHRRRCRNEPEDRGRSMKPASDAPDGGFVERRNPKSTPWKPARRTRSSARAGITFDTSHRHAAHGLAARDMPTPAEQRHRDRLHRGSKRHRRTARRANGPHGRRKRQQKTPDGRAPLPPSTPLRSAHGNPRLTRNRSIAVV